jgi:sialate O-acetylesterase
MKRLILGVLFLGLPAAARADVHPNGLCTEGMVLQHSAKTHIWGTADKGEKVTVTFRDKSESAVADDKGHWSVALDTGAAGGPFAMTIAGNNKIEYKDVLVGEVWICSGQSNMEAHVSGPDLEVAKKMPHNANLRTFNVGHATPTHPVTEVNGKWFEADPKTVAAFTSVGYFFGLDLQKDLNVPIGLIHTSWGGTRAEAWTRKEILDQSPLYKDEHPNLQKAIEKYKKDLAAEKAKEEAAKNEPKSEEPKTTEPKKTDPKTAEANKKNPKAVAKLKNPVGSNSPSVLYNGMIAPVLPYTIKGAIWYQGESNAGQAYKYRTLFPMMIENWRADWKLGDFPFYYVQLAPFNPVPTKPGESNWAELREAQAFALKLKNTGLAVITDAGNEYDIHPVPKQPAGERLARVARALTYGEKIEYLGPEFKSAKFDGDKAIVTFDHVAGGLVAKKLVPTLVRETKDKEGKVLSSKAAWRIDPDAKDVDLTGFTVAGKDHVFHVAKAVIQGDTVVLSSKEVPEPIAVRYGWADHPICGLFNREGLPASPFRTDDFRGITQPK